jgi:hypothetical protein
MLQATNPTETADTVSFTMMASCCAGPRLDARLLAMQCFLWLSSFLHVERWMLGHTPGCVNVMGVAHMITAASSSVWFSAGWRVDGTGAYQFIPVAGREEATFIHR